MSAVGTGANSEGDAIGRGAGGIGEDQEAIGTADEAGLADGVGENAPVLGPLAGGLGRTGINPSPTCPGALKGAGFIAHGEEERAVGKFGDLGFARGGIVRDGRGGDGPGFAVVGAVEEAGVGWTCGFAELGGEDEGAVAKLNAVAGAAEEESPVAITSNDVGSDIDRLGPREAVVGTFGEDELSGFIGGDSGAGAFPATIAFGPEASHEDGFGLRIDKNRGVTDAIAERVGFVFVEVEDRFGFAPGIAVVGAAHESDIDILREVGRRLVTEIEDGEECSLGSGGETGDAVGVHAVIAVFAEDLFIDLRIRGLRICCEERRGQQERDGYKGE